MLIILLISFKATAQNAEGLIKKGNEAYNQKQYDLAQENYKKALNKNPINTKAQYNLGNALYRNKKSDDAVNAYDITIQNSKLPAEKQGAFYNKGVVLQHSKKLPECIAAYKDALRLNPADEDARINLQQALQQQQQDQKENKQQNKKNQKEDQKKDPKQPKENKEQNDTPQKQPSKMTQKEAEEKLKALSEQEKKLQDKLKKVGAASPEKPEKDW